MPANITASKLYDYTQCPHRVWRDVHGPQEERKREPNRFVQLLWEKGIIHEEKVVGRLGKFLDLSEGTHEARFQKTIEAMRNGEDLIYQGVLKDGKFVGIPDLLKRTAGGSYLPIDIKSGTGLEGADEENGEEGRPKKHYAVQLCLYIELLEKAGFAEGKIGAVIDGRGEEVGYDMDQPIGKRSATSFWDFYQEVKEEVESLVENKKRNKPAMVGVCKLCHWYDSCKKWSKENGDLAEIFYLGRSKRDRINMDTGIEKVADFAEVDPAVLLEKKKKDRKFLRGVGKNTLEKLVTRAKVLAVTKKPVLYGPIEFPKTDYELFFDIEDDPIRDFVYMHGVYERRGSAGRFVDFTAREDTATAEREAFKNFWDYVGGLPEGGFSAYYYSHHEKSVYRKMQKTYPDAVSAEQVENFFRNPNVIDLYKVILKRTDWPLGSYSLKEIAQYLGFEWRDKTPSGALSIEWFNKYLESGKPEDLKRILEYNEDDCKATMAVKDALERLSAGS